jgi:predicted polyphosphate/ATP-dependent NAD kinase
MKKLGLIINPIAGMGGKVGLKGTDGIDILERARSLGARPESPSRAIEAVRTLTSLQDHVQFVTPPGEMGEMAVKQCGMEPEILAIEAAERTTADDTRAAAAQMVEHNVDLLLFAGGDGTARDILSSIAQEQVSLGIHTGVKMHSAVFAVNPSRAGELAASYLADDVQLTRAAEVMDIDEQALREGHVSARLFGYMTIPYRRGHLQGLKSGSADDERAAQRSIAEEIRDRMEKDTAYVIGPGTTTATIMELMSLTNSLVGIDVVLNGTLVGKDLGERALLETMGDKEFQIIVTPVGGQGFLFGRGNQPISAEIIRKAGKERILIVATPQKLSSLGGAPLRVDTGNAETDRWLSGYYKVISGYRAMCVYRVASF